MSSNDYYIGLDLGTNSVGWAVTSTDYKLDRFKQQDMWGIRLFEEAKTAEKRRSYRIRRRLNARKKERLRLVQSIFAEEMAKKDNEFFLRLKESKFILSDKNVDTLNILFNDKNYTDRNYYAEFPTIAHLKKAFIDGEKITDIRKLYLVVAHYMKHRGHFLVPTLDAEKFIEFENVFDKLQEYLDENYGFKFNISDMEAFKNTLKNPALGKKRKGDTLIELAGVKEKWQEELLNAISGSSVAFADMLNPEFDEELIESITDSEITKISFADNLDEKWDFIESTLQNRFELIELLGALYNWSILAQILSGYSYMSYAKVAMYEEHASDLAKLKKLIRTYLPKEYNKFFDSNDSANNYASYIGMTRVNGKKLPIKKTSGRGKGKENEKENEKNCTQEELCKQILNKILKKMKNVKPEDMEIFTEISEKAENDRLLPKQMSVHNSVIPYQVNAAELKIILENAAKNFPFLDERDESGFTNGEKIQKIFEFRIPYYVGPLAKKNKDDVAWIVKKRDEKITPWNFDEVVNKKESAKNFIRRMTNKCTYLFDEDVVAKDSILYSKYRVLNELNNLKINGKPITVELKQNIYNDLFKKNKRVTQKKLKSYLKSVMEFDTKSDIIGGIDGDFKSSLRPFIEFEEIFESSDFDEDMVEHIIEWIGLFGEDKSILKEAISDKYGEKITPEQLKKIVKLKYSGWGRLSKKLLDGITVKSPETGNEYTFIELMYATNYNFMEALHYCGFKEVIDETNSLDKDETPLEIIEKLNLSPSVKRPVIQAQRIVEEIVKIKKSAPSKIFVEMARGKTNSGRTQSRKKRLQELYKSCKKQEPELFAKLELETDVTLRRDRLYLYYTQFGKCMYTGLPLPIENIYDNNVCDVDHIYPQSKIKDDSLNNRVLVLRKTNELKGNMYPINSEIQKKMVGFWSALKHKGLISAEKYERLTRATHLTNDELSQFVARQLVETRQSTKALATLLKQLYGDDETEIVYVKGGIVSDFRNGKNIERKDGAEPIKFIKCRDVNDLHHAKDAYLNIVVGNVYHTRITKNKANFIAALKHNKISMNHLFDHEIENTWTPGINGSMKIVMKTMKKNSILFTRHAFEKTGGFYDEMIVKKGPDKLTPIKSSDERLHKTDIYGGYNSMGVAYFFVAQYEKKGKKIGKTERAFFSVPILYKKEYEENPNRYCEEHLGLKNPEIIIRRVKINTLFRIDGFKAHLSGNGDERRLLLKPAIQLILSDDDTSYVKRIGKYLERCGNKELDEIAKDYFVSKGKNIHLYKVLTDKLLNSIYKHQYAELGQTLVSTEVSERFESLSVYRQCFALREIIKRIRCTAEPGKLRYLGKDGKSIPQCQLYRISKTVVSNRIHHKQFQVVNQSVTGLFENRVDLLK